MSFGSDEPGQPAAPEGTPDNPLKLTDPKAMRALAHPARLAILEHLALNGPATATECADVTGLSPSACSYHLRALARYGFTEEDQDSAADGRQRPWRAKTIAFSFGEDADESPAARVAGQILRDAILDAVAGERARFEASKADYPAPWQAASGNTLEYMHVTAAELQELRERIRGLIAPYRRFDPAEQPAGARRVMSLIEMIPAFAPQDVTDSAEEE